MKLIKNSFFTIVLITSIVSVIAMEQTNIKDIITNDFKAIADKQALSGKINNSNNKLNPMTNITEAGLSDAAKQALAAYKIARNEYAQALLAAPRAGRSVKQEIFDKVKNAHDVLISALSGRAVILPPPGTPIPSPIIQPTPGQKEPSKPAATIVKELINKHRSGQQIDFSQFNPEVLKALEQYLKAEVDRGERLYTLGVYNAILKHLKKPTYRPGAPITPAPQPTTVSERVNDLIAILTALEEEAAGFNFADYTDAELQQAKNKIGTGGLVTIIQKELDKRSPVRPPVQEEEKIPARKTVNLIDTNRLNQLGLCPLFQGLDRETQAAYGLQGVAGQCTKNIANNQTLMQLNTINQFALEGIGYATCPVQSLRSISLLMQYIQTGDQKFLRDLNDERNARQFVEGLTRKGFGTEWLTKEWLEDVVRKANIPGVNQAQVTVLDNVLEFDPQYEGIFVVGENIAKMRRVKQIVRDGLKKDNFVHAFVIGTSDQAQLGGGEARIHFFAFAVIKQGNTIQYIVVDTAPAAYHLGGYNLKRLEYLIQLLTKGSTTINLQQEAQKQ